MLLLGEWHFLSEAQLFEALLKSGEGSLVGVEELLHVLLLGRDRENSLRHLVEEDGQERYKGGLEEGG